MYVQYGYAVSAQYSAIPVQYCKDFRFPRLPLVRYCTRTRTAKILYTTGESHVKICKSTVNDRVENDMRSNKILVFWIMPVQYSNPFLTFIGSYQLSMHQLVTCLLADLIYILHALFYIASNLYPLNKKKGSQPHLRFIRFFTRRSSVPHLNRRSPQ